MIESKKRKTSTTQTFFLRSVLVFFFVYLGGIFFSPEVLEVTDEVLTVALEDGGDTFTAEVLGESIAVLEPRETILPVIAVVDGDTIKVQQNDDIFTIRLLGIDTPETVAPGTPVECYGPEASDEMKRLVLAKDVLLMPDSLQENTDRYGRYLRFVYLPEGLHVNAHMVEKGFAKVYTKAKTSLDSELIALQKQAQLLELGLWGMCGF